MPYYDFASHYDAPIDDEESNHTTAVTNLTTTKSPAVEDKTLAIMNAETSHASAWLVFGKWITNPLTIVRIKEQ